MTDPDLTHKISKPCKKCGQTKPVEDFYRTKSSKDGYQTWCKDCTKLAVKASKAKQKEQRQQRKNERKEVEVRQMAELLEFTPEEVEMAVSEIQEKSKSTSHSAVLAVELIRSGLNPRFIAAVLRKMFEAKRYIMDTKMRELVEMPDWQMIMQAVKTIIDVCGFQFAPKKDDEAVPPQLVQIYNDMRNIPVQAKIARHEDLKNRIGESRISEILGGHSEDESDEGGNGIPPSDPGT